MSEAPRQGLLGRLLRAPHPAGARAALAARFAAAPDGLRRSDRDGLVTDFRLRTSQADALGRELVEAEAGRLDPHGFHAMRPRLTATAAAFGMEASDVERVFADRARALYAEAVRAAASDDELTDVEMAAAEALQQQVGLSEADAQEVLAQVVGPKLTAAWASALADLRLSPEEEAELDRLRGRLRIRSVVQDGETRAFVDKARRLWAIENEPLKAIEAPASLQRNEVAYAVAQVEAVEERQRTVRLSYAGPVLSFKVMPGVRYRAASYQGRVGKESYEHSFGTGALIVTSKRLIFMGPQKAMSPRLDSILTIEAYADGLRVVRGAGKPTMYYYQGAPPEFFAEILQRARRDA